MPGTQPDRLYTTLVLFGRESRVSVASPQTFRDLSDGIARVLSLACPDLKARGRVLTDKGKTITPRQGPWSKALRERWVESLQRGSFHTLELFDAAWADDRPPDAYGALYKHWDYAENGCPTERCKMGVENSITLGLRIDFVDHALDRLKEFGKSLLPKIDCVYGFLESPVPWDQNVGDGVYEDMIDLRWHNRVDGDYCNGELHISLGVPRVYRGNLFSASQLKRGKTPRGMLKLPGVTAVEEWPNRLTYVELAKEPKYKSKPPPGLGQFIKFIPQE